MENRTVLTFSGLQARQEELKNLKTVRRKEVAEKIKEARGQGDLSENAEYDAAKDEQSEIENRIVELEKMLKNPIIINDEDLDDSKIRIGNTVTILDLEFDERQEYAIVGVQESDPANGRLSNESPLGVALIGRSVGDIVNVEAPDGTISFEILDIKAKSLED